MLCKLGNRGKSQDFDSGLSAVLFHHPAFVFINEICTN